MQATAFSSRCRRLLFTGALPILLAIAAAPAGAQVFAVGGGGTLANDGASSGGPSSFSKGGYFGFAEMRLESYTVLQLRIGEFRLPGHESDSPQLRVTEYSMTVAYLFKEDWFEAGFYGGPGVFRIAPDAPSDGQTATDVRQNVWGLKGGVLTLIRLGQGFDVRLEGGVTYLASTYSHAPIVLGAGLSYRF